MHSNETTQVEALTTRISLLMARLEQLVQTWRATGELPMKEIGGSWFISRTELQKYMNTNPNKTKGAGHVRS